MTEGPATDNPAPTLPRWKQFAFLFALAVYYIVYYFLFAGKVVEYFKDVYRHFEFVRRLL